MREKAGLVAWGGLIAGICVYEYYAPPKQLLSEVIDRGLEHPVGRVGIPLAIGAVSLHLLNILPPKIDPIHQLATLARNRNLIDGDGVVDVT